MEFDSLSERVAKTYGYPWPAVLYEIERDGIGTDSGIT